VDPPAAAWQQEMGRRAANAQHVACSHCRRIDL